MKKYLIISVLFASCSAMSQEPTVVTPDSAVVADTVKSDSIAVDTISSDSVLPE